MFSPIFNFMIFFPPDIPVLHVCNMAFYCFCVPADAALGLCPGNGRILRDGEAAQLLKISLTDSGGGDNYSLSDSFSLIE